MTRPARSSVASGGNGTAVAAGLKSQSSSSTEALARPAERAKPVVERSAAWPPSGVACDGATRTAALWVRLDPLWRRRDPRRHWAPVSAPRRRPSRAPRPAMSPGFSTQAVSPGSSSSSARDAHACWVSRDDDAGRTAENARRRETGRDLDPTDALRRRIAGQARWTGSSGCGSSTRPGLRRGVIRRRDAPASSVPRPLSRDDEGRSVAQALATRGQRSWPRWRWRGRGGRGTRQIGCDVGAAAGAGADVTLRCQPLIGQDHGPARHAELFRQSARGRQSCTTRQRTGEDAPAAADPTSPVGGFGLV